MSCIPWLSPVFTCIRQYIKLSLSHALLYSFIVFKYVILILRKERYILGRTDLYFWGSHSLGRSWSIFRDLGSKVKILLGSQGNYFQGSGEINALFSGIKGAQTPPLGGLICCSTLALWELMWELMLTCREFKFTCRELKFMMHITQNLHAHAHAELNWCKLTFCPGSYSRTLL